MPLLNAPSRDPAPMLEQALHEHANDPRLVTSYQRFDSPDGYFEGRGYLAMPAGVEGATERIRHSYRSELLDVVA